MRNGNGKKRGGFYHFLNVSGVERGGREGRRGERALFLCRFASHSSGADLWRGGFFYSVPILYHFLMCIGFASPES